MPRPAARTTLDYDLCEFSSPLPPSYAFSIYAIHGGHGIIRRFASKISRRIINPFGSENVDLSRSVITEEGVEIDRESEPVFKRRTGPRNVYIYISVNSLIDPLDDDHQPPRLETVNKKNSVANRRPIIWQEERETRGHGRVKSVACADPSRRSKRTPGTTRTFVL